MEIHKIQPSLQDADDRQHLVARLAELILEIKEISDELEQEPVAFASMRDSKLTKWPCPVLLAAILALLLL